VPQPLVDGPEWPAYRTWNYAGASAKEEFFKSSGPLLTTGLLAKILSRSEEGLRISLRSDTEFSRQVNAARKRFGRRVYFSTEKSPKSSDSPSPMLTSISAIQPPIEVISPLSRKQVRLIEATVDLRSVSFIDEKSGKFSITPLLIVLNQHVLDLNRGNKLRAARQLSISRSTLYRILGNESFLTH
jgi:hypothetical protein